jgi:hypothetical protein
VANDSLTLKDLKAVIDKLYEESPAEELDALTVRIALAEASIGAMAATKLKAVVRGMDHEHNWLIIFPAEEIVRRCTRAASPLLRSSTGD